MELEEHKSGDEGFLIHYPYCKLDTKYLSDFGGNNLKHETCLVNRHAATSAYFSSQDYAALKNSKICCAIFIPDEDLCRNQLDFSVLLKQITSGKIKKNGLTYRTKLKMLETIKDQLITSLRAKYHEGNRCKQRAFNVGNYCLYTLICKGMGDINNLIMYYCKTFNQLRN